MSNSAAEAAAAAMAGAKVFGDYNYLNNRMGKYRLEIQALKFNDKGKPIIEGTVIDSKPNHTVESLTKIGHRSPMTACEPWPVGTSVSHLEDISDPRNGGAGRLLKALLAILAMSEADIAKCEETRTENGKTKVVELEGENAKRKWLIKMMDQAKQPTAFLHVDVEIEPREVPAKGDKPAAVFSKEKWSTVDLTEAELDAVDAKRVAAKLPPMTESL